jgi:phospholipase/lecithinase/hemolysin
MSTFSKTVRDHVLILLLLFIAFAPNALSQTPTFSQIVVFGDSLSDTGNLRHRMEDKFQFGYPGGEYNYSDGRFTNSSDTNPKAQQYLGVWHEQLAKSFLNLPAATNSLNGGTNYAFGGATTNDNTKDVTVFSNPEPFGGGNTTVTVDNLGKQVTDYLSKGAADANALYIVWGGGNDLFNDRSDANVTGTANRMVALVLKLARAGARNILVPNVPPLGSIPKYLDNPTRAQLLNDASASYRAQLSAGLDGALGTLSGEGITIQLYRLDVYAMFLRLAADPEASNLVDFRHSAQGQDVNPDRYLFWDDIHPTTKGHYLIANEAFRVLNGTVMPQGKSLNVSTRVTVGTDQDVLIGGVIITGTESKQVLFRGIGPSLNVAGVPVTGRLADPTLELYQGDTLITSNDNWKQSQQAEIAATGIAPSNDLESAILQTLAPGNYTAVLRGANNTTGIGLVEAYDLTAAANSTLANISTRGAVGTDDNVLIGGFIVGSGDNATVVIRGIGPSLAQSNIANPLADPTLDLYDANGAAIANDDNWQDKGQQGAISATGLAPGNNLEAAMIKSLPPGNYTAIVRGKNGTTGVGLVEIYNIR